MRSIAAAGLSLLYLLSTAPLWAQPATAVVPAHQNRAHQVLQSAIQALGGPAWLDLRTIRTTGRTAAFFRGSPTGALQETTETTVLPDRQRIDSAGGKVVQVYLGAQAWEITYKGKKNLSGPQAEDHLRWRDHSLGVVLRRWFRAPGTILIDDGPSLVERRPADKITLVNSQNEAVTLELDTQSHLPLRLSFQWRDPRFHDRNLDAVEYDNYHRVDGIATPFTITRTHNGQTVSQRFLHSVQYNRTLPPELFDPGRIAAQLH